MGNLAVVDPEKLEIGAADGQEAWFLPERRGSDAVFDLWQPCLL